MKLAQALLVFAILMFCAPAVSNAQQEDTLKVSVPLNQFPQAGKPLDIKQSGYQMLPGSLGVDDIEFFIAKKDSTDFVKNLTTGHYMQFYQKEYLDWGRKRYGSNIDLDNFIYRKGSKRDCPFCPDKHSLYHHDYKRMVDSIKPRFMEDMKINTGISIEWPLSKAEKWFRELYKVEEQNYGLSGYIDTLKLRVPQKQQLNSIINNILEEKKKRESENIDNIKPLTVKRKYRAVYW